MRVLSLALLLWVRFSSIGFGGASPHGPTTITILHTNDMHARYLSREASWVRTEPRPIIGGFVRLAEVIDSLRGVYPLTLTLDAGDVMTGNPIADRPYRGAQGGLLIEMMNRIRYDAWSPGNHEFDISQSNLQALFRIAKFPSLAANLADSSGAQYSGTIPYTILTRGDLRIGVIGLISQRLSSLVLQENLVGVRVKDPASTLEQLIVQLDPVTDLLIALTHQGYQADSILATEIAGLDIIVGGHSHTRLQAPRAVNGVVIVQGGSYCENLGVLTVSVENDAVASSNGSLIPLWVTRPPTAGPLVDLVDSVRTVIEREYGEVIMTLGETWRRHEPAQRLGIAVTEAQRIAAGVDVAFMNGGGIRRDLSAGPVTLNDVYEVLPFRNVLGTFQLSGRELRTALSHVVGKETDVIITGLRAEWVKKEGGEVELRRVFVGETPLEDTKAYRCAASDYFVGQFSRYCGLPEPATNYSSVTVFEAVERYLRQEGIQERLPALGIRQQHVID